jgi:GAF domain-containing protein
MPRGTRSGGDLATLDIVGLVTTALRQERLSGLSEMLGVVARSAGAHACILWRLAPGSDLETDPPEGRLFVLAQWMADPTPWATHNLGLKSATGHAILTGKPYNVKDVAADPLFDLSDTFFEQTGARVFCAIPIEFRDGLKGALNVYRNSQPFQENEISRIEEMARLVPALNQTVRDKAGSLLMKLVSQFIQDAERQSLGGTTRKDRMQAVIQSICDQVAETFQCLECSVFFEDTFILPGTFEMIATSWRGEFHKRSYTKNEPALTSWILRHKRPVNLFNLTDFRDPKEALKIQKEYPDLEWGDSLDFQTVAREKVARNDGGSWPPFSFAGAPILVGDDVLGAIRCCTAVRPPYYYAEGERELLELAAAQIGQYWSNWLTRRAADEENQSWRTLVDRVSKMNAVVQEDSLKGVLDEGKLRSETLAVAESVIRGADVLSIRLLDETAHRLYYSETLGEAWTECSPRREPAIHDITFSVDAGQPASIGAHVASTGKLYSSADVTKDPLYQGPFPRIRRIICAPIRYQDKVVGTLDIRGSGPSDFPKHAVSIAELLGQQLGLYQYLASAIQDLRGARNELKVHMRKQTETYQDLGHQLKSPIFQAQARIQAALRLPLLDEKLQTNLLAIRGLVGKAKRVSMNIRLFGQLAGRQVEVSQLAPLKPDDLIKNLIEYASDHRLLIGPERISFRVEPAGFEVLRRYEVRVDNELLYQAINNVLDNAFKYSFPKTTVRITGGVTAAGRFHITVINEGIRLRAYEALHATERGWRSEDAESTTGEGEGLGLWIVDHIMKAHGGDILVLPTTAANQTEVKLVFPAAKL